MDLGGRSKPVCNLHCERSSAIEIAMSELQTKVRPHQTKLISMFFNVVDV